MQRHDCEENTEITFPFIAVIQQTVDDVIRQLGYDPSESENEDTIMPRIASEIGESIETVIIETCNDIPIGYGVFQGSCHLLLSI